MTAASKTLSPLKDTPQLEFHQTLHRFGEILTVGYFLNGLSILDMKFANLVTLWRHLNGRDDW